MIEAIREELRQSADTKYKNFQESLVPGLTTMMGVRMPKLREWQRRLQKKILRNFWKKRMIPVMRN